MKFVKFTQYKGGPIYINPDHVFMCYPDDDDNLTYIHPAFEPLHSGGDGIWVEGRLDEVARKLQSGQ